MCEKKNNNNIRRSKHNSNRKKNIAHRVSPRESGDQILTVRRAARLRVNLCACVELSVVLSRRHLLAAITQQTTTKTKRFRVRPTTEKSRNIEKGRSATVLCFDFFFLFYSGGTCVFWAVILWGISV